jgi:hypothetical protein
MRTEGVLKGDKERTVNRLKNFFASAFRDTTFGVILFLLALVLALVTTKAVHFIYAMF